jgi:hypothetical protein
MNILRFRVVLDTTEDVFRDIEVAAEQTFEQLYDTIVQSFEFKGGVMSSFFISNENWDKGQEITLLDMSEKGESEFVMSKCVLNDFMVDERQRIILVYDFMRMWIIYVELIDEFTAPAGSHYPKVSMKFGDAPDEESKEMADTSFEVETFGLSDDDKGEENIEDEIGDMFDDFTEYSEED